jgi:hypothetical protein
MARTGKCRACGKLVAIDAAACPGCGKRNPALVGWTKGCLVIALILGALAFGLQALTGCADGVDTGPTTVTVEEHAEIYAEAFCERALLCEEETDQDWFTHDTLAECVEDLGTNVDFPAGCVITIEASEACETAVRNIDCADGVEAPEACKEPICE